MSSIMGFIPIDTAISIFNDIELYQDINRESEEGDDEVDISALFETDLGKKYYKNIDSMEKFSLEKFFSPDFKEIRYLASTIPKYIPDEELDLFLSTLFSYLQDSFKESTIEDPDLDLEKILNFLGLLKDRILEWKGDYNLSLEEAELISDLESNTQRMLGIFIFSVQSYTEMYYKEIVRKLLINVPSEELFEGMKMGKLLFTSANPVTGLQNMCKFLEIDLTKLGRGFADTFKDFENFSRIRNIIAHGNPESQIMSNYKKLVKKKKLKGRWEKQFYEYREETIKSLSIWVQNFLGLEYKRYDIVNMIRNYPFKSTIRSKVREFITEELSILIEFYTGIDYYKEILLKLGLFLEKIVEAQIRIWQSEI